MNPRIHRNGLGPKTGSRRARTPNRDNSDRWLVSYADFITLLFAFFVVLFAASDIDSANMARLVEAYASHLPGYSPPPASQGAEIEAASGESKSPGPIEELEPVKEHLEEQLAAMVEDGKVSVTLQPRGLVLSLQEAAFFPIGKASFRSGADKLLVEVGQAVAAAGDRPIRLEGHTDDVPIHNHEFASNWELSSWRAIEVMKLLTGRFGVPPNRVSVVGYGDLRPLAANDTARGRARNRRVDIVILSRSAAARTPRRKAG